MEGSHYNQQPRRKAEFIRPPNLLKAKVGSGGLSEQILDKAQALLENTTTDFRPLAEMYLESMARGIESAKNCSEESEDSEQCISAILYPAMQLKANGGMFHYPLITRIGDHLVQFLEVIESPDEDVLEIVIAFHTTMKAVVMGQVSGDGGRYGADLVQELEGACYRYFEKYPSRARTQDDQ